MQIKFLQKYIYIKQFEQLFLKKWDSTHNKDCSLVEFDLSKVEYMDLMQICHLFIWIESLLKEEKKVVIHFIPDTSFELARNKGIYEIIRNYGFFSQLSKYRNFETSPDFRQNKNRLLVNTPDSPLIHLTSFEKLSELDLFLDSLEHPDFWRQNNTHNNEYEKILRTGIRDIVLRELGYNVFVHAEGSPALIAVCKKSRKQMLLKGNPSPYRAIAEKSDIKEYIQVIIADLGPGIPNKLLNAYKADPIAKKKLGKINVEHIIEYAFWKDTSSRRRDTEEIIEGDDILSKLVPPTGLYFVKKLVENSGGILCVRAKDVIWGIRFSNKKAYYLKKDDLDIKDLGSMLGNIIQIILPIQDEKIRLKPNKINTNYHLPKIDCYVSFGYEGYSHNNEKAETVTLIDKIRTICLKEKSNETHGMLVDLKKRSIHAKRLYQICIFLMFWQESKKPIILVNVPYDESWLNVCEEIENSNFSFEWLPLQWISTENKGVLGSKKNHEELTFSYSSSDIEKEIYNVKRNHLEDKIMGVYIGEAKVYLPQPSEYFVKGFFNLSLILNDADFCSDFVDILMRDISDKNIKAIVTTSIRLLKLGKMFAEKIRFPQENVYFQSSKKAPASILINIGKLKNGNVLILADVVVSGSTVKRIEKNLRQIKKETATVSIVSDKKLSDVLSIIEHDFEVHQKKPSDWVYNEIKLINSASHQLLDIPKAEDTQSYVTESVLEQWAEKDNAIAIGHFSNNETCYLAFFDTYLIEEKYGEEIFEHIRIDLEELRKKGKKKKLTFGFPANNKAAESICKKLASYLGGNLEYMPKEKGNIGRKKHQHNSTNSDEILVFVDTASSTTKTLRHAMEWASSTQKGMLQAYIVLNRASFNDFSFMQGIDVFKKVEVRMDSWVRIEIPAYEHIRCPACLRKTLIEKQLKSPLPMNCKNILHMEAEALSLIPIQEARGAALGKAQNHIKGFGKALYFRHLLELSTNEETMTYAPIIQTLIGEIEKSREGIRELINVMFLEISVIISEQKYLKIWNDELREQLVNSCINVIHDGDSFESTDHKAIWLAANIDYRQFIAKLSPDNWKYSEGACRAMATVALCYATQETRDSTIGLLRKISTKIESFKVGMFSPDIISSLRQIATSLEFDIINEEISSGSYCESINLLSEIFFQKGLSHTVTSTVFDSVRRIVDKDDLEKCKQSAIGENGFYLLFKRNIFPSLIRVRNAWTKEFVSQAPYIANEQFLKDIKELISLIEITSAKHEEKSLDENEWKKAKELIKVLSSRIHKEFINVDSSSLKMLLTQCDVDLKQTLVNVCQDLETQTANNNQRIIIPENSANLMVLMPVTVLTDLIRTLITNAISYSTEGTDIVCEISGDDQMYFLYVRSVPKNNNKPNFMKDHGLSRAQAILEGYDGALKYTQIESAGNPIQIEINLPKNKGIL